MKTHIKFLSVFLFVFGLAFGVSPPVYPAQVSVPSAPSSSSGNIVLSGAGLLPFSTVTLLIEHSSGAREDRFATIAADGSFSVEYLPGMPGRYNVKVLDQDGNEIGGGDFQK